jgi:phosphoglycolate phosphatase
MASSRLRLAVFDLDGTLLDSAASIVEGVRACWEACGFPEADPTAIRRVIGLPWDESIQTLLPGAGPAEFAMVRAYHDEIARGERPRPSRVADQVLFPGAAETLRALEEDGFLLSIITSRSYARLRDLLDDQGIADHFVLLRTVDHGPGKPAPDLMHQTLAETGVEAADTVMIGDTIYDIQMARNAGTHAIGVSWGVHEPHELTEAGAHHVAEAFEELHPAVDRLTGGA